MGNCFNCQIQIDQDRMFCIDCIQDVEEELKLVKEQKKKKDLIKCFTKWYSVKHIQLETGYYFGICPCNNHQTSLFFFNKDHNHISIIGVRDQTLSWPDEDQKLNHFSVVLGPIPFPDSNGRI